MALLSSAPAFPPLSDSLAKHTPLQPVSVEQWMLDIILENIGYTTARVLLPVITGGKARVQKLNDEKLHFDWGVAKDVSGKYVVDSVWAGWFGIFIWIAFGVIMLSVL